MKYPNTGVLFTSTNKRNDRAPDMFGDVKIEIDLLKTLMNKAEDGLVTIKLDGWKKKDKNGNAMVSMKVNTFEKAPRQEQNEKDPWE